MAAKKISAEAVCDIIAQCQESNATAVNPIEEEVLGIVHWFNVFAQHPLDEQFIDNLMADAIEMREEQKVLSAAADILRRNLASAENSTPLETIFGTAPHEWWSIEHHSKRISGLRTAIAAIEDSMNVVGFWRDMPKTNKPKPWSIMAGRLGIETLRAIQAAQARSGRKTQTTAGDRDGAVAKSVSIMLKLITGEENSREQVFEAVQRAIKAGLKH